MYLLRKKFLLHCTRCVFRVRLPFQSLVHEQLSGSQKTRVIRETGSACPPQGMAPLTCNGGGKELLG